MLGNFDLETESKTVAKIIQSVDFSGTVLDLSSGLGYWAEYFALRFNKVVAVESSISLYKGLVNRCRAISNIIPVHSNALSFKPTESYTMIFMGGLLMYLNQEDVIYLLQKFNSFLTNKGIILCRESTVRTKTMTRLGAYQAVYRSVDTYKQLFKQCDLIANQVKQNTAYNLLEIGIQFIEKWQKVAPKSLQATPLLGRIIYFGLRFIEPIFFQLSKIINFKFTKLTNHFFQLKKVMP